MCWQCVYSPDKYLPGAEFIRSEGNSWETEYPARIFRWQGKTWRTNPDADWLFAGKAIPGEVDCDGIPYFDEVA